jgi:hypothetical protein
MPDTDDGDALERRPGLGIDHLGAPGPRSLDGNRGAERQPDGQQPIARPRALWRRRSMRVIADPPSPVGRSAPHGPHPSDVTRQRPPMRRAHAGRGPGPRLRRGPADWSRPLVSLRRARGPAPAGSRCETSPEPSRLWALARRLGAQRRGPPPFAVRAAVTPSQDSARRADFQVLDGGARYSRTSSSQA